MVTLAWFRVGPGRFHLAETWGGVPTATIRQNGAQWIRVGSGRVQVASSWSALMEAR